MYKPGRIGGSMQKITSSGVTVIIDDNGKVQVEFDKSASARKHEDIKVTADKIIKGDVVGNINVEGNNVTVHVEGNVVGSIRGATTVTVEGDHIG
jgi:hypothetical protein